jgi:hypothetical protein
MYLAIKQLSVDGYNGDFFITGGRGERRSL